MYPLQIVQVQAASTRTSTGSPNEKNADMFSLFGLKNVVNEHFATDFFLTAVETHHFIGIQSARINL